MTTTTAPTPDRPACSFVPPFLLQRLAEADEPTLVELAQHVLELDALLRERRGGADAATPQPAVGTGAAWQVHDAGGGTDLPGRLVRSAGQPESGDRAVDEAGLGLAETLALLADWGRSSYDDRGATAVATVHYGRDYANAFWDGTQLVFGDGDGQVFGRFTEPIDVLGHELAHALTQYTAALVYQDQSGALNESMSDVVGACVRQRVLGQDAADADWLIGKGIFLPGVQGRALRSMVEPGTAYDDPRLGKDPQPGHLRDYVETTEDNGGVHINSGIPNKAFQLAATAIGGRSWDGAGRIWYAALTSGIPPRCDFARFAAATVAAAGEHADTVTKAWQDVGVTPDAESDTGRRRGGEGGGRRVAVVRSGGVAGMRTSGSVELDDAEDPRAAEVQALLERLDVAALEARAATPPSGADYFVYDLDVPGLHVSLPEPLLAEDERRLVNLVLDL